MEPKNRQLIINYIKQRKPDVVESVLDNAMFDAEQEVLGYCHVAEISHSMIYVLSRIVLEFIEREEVEMAQGADADPKGLKSIKQGDTTMEFINSVIETNKQIILRYRTELNAFRKMVF